MMSEESSANITIIAEVTKRIEEILTLPGGTACPKFPLPLYPIRLLHVFINHIVCEVSSFYLRKGSKKVASAERLLTLVA